MITPFHRQSSLDAAAPQEEVAGRKGNRRKRGKEENLKVWKKRRGQRPVLLLDSYPGRQKKRRLTRTPLQSATDPPASSRVDFPASV